MNVSIYMYRFSIAVPQQVADAGEATPRGAVVVCAHERDDAVALAELAGLRTDGVLAWEQIRSPRGVVGALVASGAVQLGDVLYVPCPAHSDSTLPVFEVDAESATLRGHVLRDYGESVFVMIEGIEN